MGFEWQSLSWCRLRLKKLAETRTWEGKSFGQAIIVGWFGAGQYFFGNCCWVVWCWAMFLWQLLLGVFWGELAANLWLLLLPLFESLVAMLSGLHFAAQSNKGFVVCAAVDVLLIHEPIDHLWGQQATLWVWLLCGVSLT